MTTGPQPRKALHVGHLPSFAIGESLRRILLEIGHDVLFRHPSRRDWGLQTGKLLLRAALASGPAILLLHQPRYFMPFRRGAWPSLQVGQRCERDSYRSASTVRRLRLSDLASACPQGSRSRSGRYLKAMT
ncbi:arginine--tRNA ligase [Rhizobium azibense]|uniref:arginine--tRNA ligase domain-containing protein n=1 Tax=Rhizobium azibense TaxID=1136135 RepID=UPI003CCB4572